MLKSSCLVAAAVVGGTETIAFQFDGDGAVIPADTAFTLPERDYPYRIRNWRARSHDSENVEVPATLSIDIWVGDQGATLDSGDSIVASAPIELDAEGEASSTDFPMTGWSPEIPANAQVVLVMSANDAALLVSGKLGITR